MQSGEGGGQVPVVWGGKSRIRIKQLKGSNRPAPGSIARGKTRETVAHRCQTKGRTPLCLVPASAEVSVPLGLIPHHCFYLVSDPEGQTPQISVAAQLLCAGRVRCVGSHLNVADMAANFMSVPDVVTFGNCEVCM